MSGSWAGRLAMALPVVVALGCGSTEAPKDKPTVAEIQQTRAAIEKPAPSPTPPPPVTGNIPFREWGVKEAAVDALARIGQPSVPVLIDALSDADAEVRVHAARALARMGDAGKEAVPVLIARLEDPDEGVRQAAARALGQMGPAAADAVPALIAIIKSHDAKPSPPPANLPNP
ncbi:MAG: HEAT repeat domain-containing protein [Planctomycetia bacterium]|nr:HEAT repeat domain-containing protein [Planctomycetia bacterium]